MRYQSAARNISVLLLLLMASITLRGYFFSFSSGDWDEGVYLIMAQRWAVGGLPYKAVWDQHPPGLPALLVVTQYLIADPVLGARILAMIAVVVTGFLIYLCCLSCIPDRFSSLAAGLLYIICISKRIGLVANTEIFNNLAVTFAAYLLLSYRTRPARCLDTAVAPILMRGCLIALSLGAGLQIKYNILPEALTLCALYLLLLFFDKVEITTLVTVTLSMLMCGAAPTILVGIYFWWHSLLLGFLEANFATNIRYITVIPDRNIILNNLFSGLSPVAISIIICCLSVFQGGKKSKLLQSRWQISIMTVWIAASLIDVIAPMKFHKHYFHMMYSPICIMTFLAIHALTETVRGKFALYSLIFANAWFVWTSGLYHFIVDDRIDVPRVVSQIIADSGMAPKGVYIYNYEPVVYALVRVPPPTPYVLTLELDQFSSSSGVDGPAEIRKVLNTAPEFIVSADRTEPDEAAASLDQVLKDNMDRYEPIKDLSFSTTNPRVHVYRLRDHD